MMELAPNLVKFFELSAKGGSVLAKSILNISNQADRRVHMQAGLLHPEIWEAVSKEKKWSGLPENIANLHEIDQTWKLFFKLTMEDIRDGESIEGAMKTLLQ